MSERSYESLRPGRGSFGKFSNMDLEELGLEVPFSRFVTSMQSLIWNTTRSQNVISAGGILLFGCAGIEECMLDAVIQRYPHIRKLPLKWPAIASSSKNLQMIENTIKAFFSKSREFGKAVILLENMDKMCDRGDIAKVVFEEIEILLREKRNIVILGHLTEPWRKNEDKLGLFKSKIFIPYPNDVAKVGILKSLMTEIVKEKFHEITLIPSCLRTEDYNRIIAHSAIKSASFKDLDLCVRKALDTSIRATLKLRSDEVLDYCFDAKELDDLAKSPLIHRKHLEFAASQIMQIKYAQGDMDKFIEDWNVPLYAVRYAEAGYPYAKKKPDSFYEWVCLFFCSCAETCC